MSMSQGVSPPCPVWHGPEKGTGMDREPRAVAAPREAAGEHGGRTSRQRATIAVVLVVLLTLVEVVLGIIVYGNIWNIHLATGVACGGILGFAGIDLWIRPRSDDQGTRRVRRFMPLWSLVPFLCALGASTWVHYQQWEMGLRDIGELACDVANKLAPDSCKIENRKFEMVKKLSDIKPEQIETTVEAMVADRFLLERKVSNEAARFRELARVVGHDLRRVHGDPSKVVDRARNATMMDFCITLGAQALFVLWIPFLLMKSIARANRKLAVRARGDLDPAAVRTTALPLSAAPSLRDSLDLRDKRILAEDRSFFLARLCFGTLLVLGTTYVFAPFGLKASYVMSLVANHALLGQTSFALWSTNFGAAPVMVVGFVGFLIYALVTATQRFVQDDLDDQAIFALLIRGLVMILLSFALSSSPINDEASRLFVFIAGVFPLRALEAIAKRANITIDPDFPSDGPGSFDGIPSLDPAKVFALRAAGIQSTYDLAAMPIEEIVGRVRIDPRLLGRAVDRAILIDTIGPKLVCELEAFAITSATELVAAQPAMPEAVTAKLGDAPKRAADRLAADTRVEKIRRWLAGAQA
jgi:uncharacterized protein YhhL (DUF1145 family)